MRTTPPKPETGLSGAPMNNGHCLLLCGLDVRQDFFGVAVGFHIFEDVADLAVRSDQERGSCDSHHLLAVHVLFLQYTELVDDGFILVGEKGVRKFILIFELLLSRGGVGGDAEDSDSGLGEFAVCVAEPARFYGSTRGVGLRIEEQYHGFAAKLL